MTIPPERMTAAFWVLQASALTFIFSIMSVPYNADIIAHERMSAFAYISIIEAVLKLAIVYMLLVVPFDKLIVYAILLAVVQLSIQLCYMVYCHRHFPESRYRHVKDWRLFKEMTSFAGWNLFGGLSSNPSIKDSACCLMCSLDLLSMQHVPLQHKFRELFRCLSQTFRWLSIHRL